jgi:hypothetical protein
MKPALRTAIGVPAGFVVTAVLSIATTTLLRAVWPALGQQGQGAGLEVLDAAYALLYMGVGAYVATRIGYVRAGYILSAIFGVLSVATAVMQADTAHTAGYQWLLAIGAWLFGFAGTRVGGRRQGN